MLPLSTKLEYMNNPQTENQKVNTTAQPNSVQVATSVAPTAGRQATLATNYPLMKKIAVWAFWLGITNVVVDLLIFAFIDYFAALIAVGAALGLWVGIRLRKEQDIHKIHNLYKLYIVAFLIQILAGLAIYGFGGLQLGLIGLAQVMVIAWIAQVVPALKKDGLLGPRKV